MHRYLLLLVLLLSGPGRGAEPVKVAVAANFRATLEQINPLFQQQTGYQVVLSSASTGVLVSQILHGAPFDVFFSADRESAFVVANSSGATPRGQPFCYAVGTLVLAGGNGQLSQLGDPGLSLAIANPATAPYGAAAMTVLERPEFSAGLDRKLLRGANVLQAYQFWYSGAADLALLPGAMVPDAAPVPPQWHQRLEQFALALRPVDGRPALNSYLNWIRSDTVRALITDAGYQPCP